MMHNLTFNEMTHTDFNIKEWNSLLEALSRQFGKTPDLDAILFLIGIQELKKMKAKFSKEEKQDLMHVAICKLLSQEGFYKFEDYDDAGWPHFVQLVKLPSWTIAEQETALKINILKYFNSVI